MQDGRRDYTSSGVGLTQVDRKWFIPLGDKNPNTLSGALDGAQVEANDP